MCDEHYEDDYPFGAPGQDIAVEPAPKKKRATKKRKTNMSSTKPTRKQSRRAKK